MDFGLFLLIGVGAFFLLIYGKGIVAILIMMLWLCISACINTIRILRMLPGALLSWLHQQTYYVHMFGFQVLLMVSLCIPLSITWKDQSTWLMLILGISCIVGFIYSIRELLVLGEYRTRRDAYSSEYLRKEYL